MHQRYKAKLIKFESGGIAKHLYTTIGSNSIQSYVLQAEKGQIMGVSIHSPNGDVMLTIVGADGNVLKNSSDGSTEWIGSLPADQDYYLHLEATGAATDLWLHVLIEPLVVKHREPTEEVRLDEGKTDDTLNGFLPSGGASKTYVLNAKAGQIMDVSIFNQAQIVEFSDAQLVEFIVEGPHGHRWFGRRIGGDGHATTKTFALPSNGNYTVRLLTGTNSPDIPYKVTFTIRYSSSQPNAKPMPIHFDSNLEKSLSGAMPDNGGLNRYVLGACAGQTFDIRVSSGNAPLNFTVTGPKDDVYYSESVSLQDGHLEELNLSLSQTGDYVVALHSPVGNKATLFDITFTIS